MRNAVFRRQNPGAFLGTTKETKISSSGIFGLNFETLAHRNRNDFCDLRLRCPSRTPEIAAISETREGGEDGSDRLLAAPPGQRSRDLEMICRISCSLVWLSRWLSLLFFALSVFCSSFAGRVLQTIDRPSVGPTPSGSSPFYYVDVKVCYLGGGSLDGGDPGSPRCLGPSRSTPEGCGAAHGPRHPAYPLLPRSLILLWGFGSHSL